MSMKPLPTLTGTTLLFRLIALTLMFSARPDPTGLALVWISGVLWGYTYGP